MENSLHAVSPPGRREISFFHDRFYDVEASPEEVGDDQVADEEQLWPLDQGIGEYPEIHEEHADKEDHLSSDHMPGHQHVVQQISQSHQNQDCHKDPGDRDIGFKGLIDHEYAEQYSHQACQ